MRVCLFVCLLLCLFVYSVCICAYADICACMRVSAYMKSGLACSFVFFCFVFLLLFFFFLAFLFFYWGSSCSGLLLLVDST